MPILWFRHEGRKRGTLAMFEHSAPGLMLSPRICTLNTPFLSSLEAEIYGFLFSLWSCQIEVLCIFIVA